MKKKIPGESVVVPSSHFLPPTSQYMMVQTPSSLGCVIRGSALSPEYKDALTEGLSVLLANSAYNTPEEVLAHLSHAVVLPRASVEELAERIHQNMPKRGWAAAASCPRGRARHVCHDGCGARGAALKPAHGSSSSTRPRSLRIPKNNARCAICSRRLRPGHNGIFVFEGEARLLLHDQEFASQ